MHVCVRVCMYLHACLCVYACVCESMHAYVCMCTCMHVQEHAYVCVCTNVLVFVGQKTTYRTRFSPSTMLATRVGFRQTSFMASTFTCCTNYFSIAVIKHHDQEQLKEEFILSFGSRGRLYNGRGGVAWWQNVKLRDHISPAYRKPNRGAGSGSKA